MFKNYIKIAIRNFQKHKGYSAINVFGLAIGIACCLLIFMYVKDELTYDRFQSKADRIFRINSEIDWFGNKDLMGATNVVEAKEYSDRIPGISTFTRYKYAAVVVKKGEEYVNQFNALFSDPSTFQIFDYKVVSGVLPNEFDNLNAVVIAESIALKYFNRADVAGEEMTIKLEGKMEQFVVEAVYEDFPTNSSLNTLIYLPWKKSKGLANIAPSRAWNNVSITSVLLLDEGVSADLIEKQMKAVRVELNPGENGQWVRNINSYLQPITNIHMSVGINANSGIKNASNPTYSYVLGGIGLLILILACINFANLSVARSIPRAKEIGLRKVLGARREQVAWQFLGEAFLVSFLAFVIGLILAELFLPVFSELTNKEFSAGIWQDPFMLAACFFIVCMSALLAGAYPAFFASRFSILNSLSGKVRMNGKQYLTKGLVLFQFTVAAILVIGTVAMNQQISHLLQVDLGYDDQNLAILSLNGNEKMATIVKSELAKNPNILDLSLTSGFNSATSMGYGDDSFFSILSLIDSSFIQTKGLSLLKGRMLDEGSDLYYRTNDTLDNIVVTSAFLEKVKYEGDPLGLVLNDGGEEDAEDEYRVVGVIDDFIYGSAKSGVQPLALTTASLDNGFYQQLYIRYRDGFATELEAVLEDAWKAVDPFAPVSFSFVEENNQASYAEEKRWKSIITASSTIAVIISCLGLFGMAHLSAQQRQKEIGVRKVLGANVNELVLMLNLYFTKLVIISAFVAIPVAYYFLEDWLSNFAYRITLGLSVFAIPTLITLFIAIITVSIQSYRTANSNPVDSLRNE